MKINIIVTILFFFLFPYWVLGESVIRLHNYDYSDSKAVERFLEGLRVMTNEVVLEEFKGHTEFAEVSEKVTITAYPLDGLISIEAKDSDGAEFELSITREFLRRMEHKIDVTMAMSEGYSVKADELRNELQSMDKKSPEFEMKRIEYRQVLFDIRDLMNKAKYEHEYRWRKVED